MNTAREYIEFLAEQQLRSPIPIDVSALLRMGVNLGLLPSAQAMALGMCWRQFFAEDVAEFDDNRSHIRVRGVEGGGRGVMAMCILFLLPMAGLK